MKREKYIEGGQDKDRLLIVQKMLSKGFSSRFIREWIGKEYGVKQSQQYKVLRAARLDMAEQDAQTKKELLAVNNARLEEIIMKTFKGEDFKNALKAIDLMNKSNGIYLQDEDKTNKEEKVIRVKFGG